MAPEVIKAEPYSTKVDIWSTGVMCLEMVEGEPPYMDQSTMKALFLIVSKGIPPFKKPEEMSDELKSFIKDCTMMNQEERPDAKTLLKHAFLEKRCDLNKLTPFVKKAKEEAEKALENLGDDDDFY